MKVGIPPARNGKSYGTGIGGSKRTKRLQTPKSKYGRAIARYRAAQPQRIISGRRYRLSRIAATKGEALRDQRGWHEMGELCRITKTAGGWGVWLGV